MCSCITDIWHHMFIVYPLCQMLLIMCSIHAQILVWQMNSFEGQLMVLIKKPFIKNITSWGTPTIQYIHCHFWSIKNKVKYLSIRNFSLTLVSRHFTKIIVKIDTVLIKVSVSEAPEILSYTGTICSILNPSSYFDSKDKRRN